MNFKQFLKPNWRKIVVFFCIIFFVTTITSILPHMENNPYTFIFIFILIPGTITSVIGHFNVLGMDNLVVSSLINSTVLLIDILWFYILSCLIIWIYDKVKKKK